MPKSTKLKSSASPAPSKSEERYSRANKTSKASRLTPPAEAPREAIALLKADHREVEDLFSRFESAAGDAEKRDLANAICVALKVHARLEEELFYPAAFGILEDKTLLDEAQVEHASAKDLIAQIEAGAPGEAFFDARVQVLAEYVAHHVKEEESEIFPQCARSKIDLEALGVRMKMRKQELMTGFAVSNPILALS